MLVSVEGTDSKRVSVFSDLQEIMPKQKGIILKNGFMMKWKWLICQKAGNCLLFDVKIILTFNF